MWVQKSSHYVWRAQICQNPSGGSNPATDSKLETGFEHSIQTLQYNVEEPERKHQFLLIVIKAYKAFYGVQANSKHSWELLC